MTNENPNKKGTLGEIAVCKELLKLGYEVFVEIGNHSKVDLIVLDENYRTYKIQVKAVKSKDEIVEVYSIKNCLNPKYNSTYTIQQVDIFAVYVIDKDFIFYVTSKELLSNSKSSKFRLSESRNGQTTKVRYINDYLNFEKALRGYTPHAQTENAVGDEIVQTTTLKISAANES
ncbi:hypothetical protein BH20ACI1_BH20ACI1_14760 [soil metagenome]